MNEIDRELDAAWRAASREEPSPMLDQKIRAAARREVGAVMTSMGKGLNESPAATAMPSNRWRTTARESSAGKSKTGPCRRTGNWRRQWAPEAMLKAMSKARKLLQHLGSPPRMPTACSAQSPSMSQWVCGPVVESWLAR